LTNVAYLICGIDSFVAGAVIMQCGTKEIVVIVCINVNGVPGLLAALVKYMTQIGAITECIFINAGDTFRDDNGG